MKILLVDDSRLQRLAIQKDLTRAGYTVLVAADGEEGFRRAVEESPDLVVLDMMLPKVSGPDVLRQLKANPTTREIPVVVLTGLGGVKEKKLAAEGAAAFCEKTDRLFQNNSAILIRTVKRALQGGSAWHTPAQ